MTDPMNELLRVLALIKRHPGSQQPEAIDKAIDLAKQVDRLLNPKAQPVNTVAELHALKPGRKVKDSAGDVWQKQHDGDWLLLNHTDWFRMSSEHLVHVWAPLHVLPEEN